MESLGETEEIDEDGETKIVSVDPDEEEAEEELEGLGELEDTTATRLADPKSDSLLDELLDDVESGLDDNTF
jgi:hypothetical protein